jgi:hypothetical protein
LKTIFKILVILVVAVLVGSLFYGTVTAVSSGTDQLSLPARPNDGEFDRPDQEEGAGGLQFPADAIKNLAIISIVGVIYLNAPKLLRRKKPALQVTP